MDARGELERLIRSNGDDYASLSRMIGRNGAYVQQYIKRGTPKRLAERDRGILARYFGVAEERLGAPSETSRGGEHVVVPQLDLGASAGPGTFSGDEAVRAHIGFDPRWLRSLGARDADLLSIIRVEGDSMAPTLADGDEILVDRGDAAERLRDGIYVLRREDVLIVKRLALNPAAATLSILSDNPDYRGWPDCPLASIAVVGRVVWVGRRVV